MALTCCRHVKQVEHVFALRGPRVEANRWSVADEHIERVSVEPVSSVVAVGHALVRSGGLEIHYVGLNIQ
ncbi:hypothetical protein XI09_02955 [Bradyrhizobium sp. CCBAU 11386]|nr:hypothetical protein [Bradyrhizobium sp. CCBAU 11386]